MISPKRKEIWWVNFHPSIAGEVQKIRPAIVVSNDFANLHSNRVQVVPLTSKTHKCYPCEAVIRFEGNESKAMADQIMTVSKQRLRSKVYVVSDREMIQLEKAIKVQLSIH